VGTLCMISTFGWEIAALGERKWPREVNSGYVSPEGIRSRILDQSAMQIVDTAQQTGARDLARFLCQRRSINLRSCVHHSLIRMRVSNLKFARINA